MDNFNDRPERPKFDVGSLNIKCAECGVDVTELPFQPTQREDGTYGRIFCSDCNRNRFQGRRNNTFSRRR